MPYESLIFLLGAFCIAVPFLVTMRQCLDQMAPDSRRISTTQLWLNLIPLFNLVWVFVTAYRFRQSMVAEQRRRPGVAVFDHWDKGLLTSALFVGFVLTLPFGSWNWLMFGTWVLALALYWKDIVMQMVWLMRHQVH